jgi:hypothetical protein
MKYLRRQNLNISNLLDDTILQRADGNIELNPTQKVIINGSLEFPPGAGIPGPEVSNIMYVTVDGNDDNSGFGEGPGQAKRTLKSALASAQQGTTIYVRSGEYYEDNPLTVPPKVAIIGDNLRQTIIRPLNGPVDFDVTNVERNNELVTVTTELEHGLEPKDRIRVRVKIGETPVAAGNFEVGKRYRIALLGTTDFTIIGSPYNTKETIFTATGTGAGTGTAWLAEIDETDVNIYDVPSSTTFRFRQSGSDIASTSSSGKIIKGTDLFYCNSAVYIAQMVFKGLKAPGYCVNIDKDAIVDTSPYIQNCTNLNGPFMRNGVEWLPFQTSQPDLNGTFVTGPRPLLDNEIRPEFVDIYGIDIEGAGGGVLVDGDRYSPLSPIKSMVGDAFTQISQGGVGFHITNFGYMQIVSCFAVFCSKAFYTTRGGYLSLSNSVIDFGTEGFIADGYYLDPYSVGAMPQDYYSTVGSVTVNAEGSGFATAPDVIIEPPNLSIPGARAATALASIDPITGKLNAISIEDGGYGYDFVPEITITPTNGAIVTANLQKNLTIKIGQLSNKPQVGSIAFLGDDPQAYYIASTVGSFVSFSYDEVKCRRDAAIILDGVYYDAALGTNFNSIINGLSYRRAVASEVIDEQLEETIGALNFLKSRSAVSLSADSTAQNRSNTAFNEIIDITQSGPNQADPFVFPSPSGVDVNLEYAKDQLVNNKEFIKAEIIAWINNNYPSVSYNQTTCARDIGLIIDSLCYDTLYGGNSAIITAARAYFEGAVSVLPEDQKAATSAAMTRLSTVCQDVVREIVITPTVGNTESQDFSGSPATIAEATLLDDLIGIIKAVIDLDNLAGLPVTTYPSVSWIDSNLSTALTTLKTESPTIIEEMIDYINLNYVTPFKYDQQKCRRDIGLIVDAVLADAILNTNHQATFAGLSYLRSYSSKVTSSQKSQTIDGLIKAKDLTVALITDSALQNKVLEGFDIVTDIINLGLAVVPAISTSPTTVRDPGFYEAAQILLANKEFIQDELVAWGAINYPVFTYDSVKCSRDIGIILNAVLDDMIFDSNYRTITAGLAYLRSYSAAVIEQQKNETIAGINKARDLTIALISNIYIKEEIERKFEIITDIIEDGNNSSLPALLYTDAVGQTNSNNAARVLQINKEFLKAEVIAWINMQIMSNTAPFNDGFSYNVSKCKRDVGYIVDALTYDLIYGGNLATLSAANSYFVGAVSFIDGQQVQSAAAFSRLKSVVNNVVQNFVVSKSSGNIEDQITVLDPGTSAEASVLDGLVDLVNDIVLDGTTSAVEIAPDYSLGIYYSDKNVYKTTILSQESAIRAETIDFINQSFATPYNEEKCRRDISYIIDCMVYDLTYEGNSQTTIAAAAYAEGSVLGKEIEQTLETYKYWKQIVDEIVKNKPIIPSMGNLTEQVTSYPLGSPANSDGPARKTQDLLQIVVDVVDYGKGYIPNTPVNPDYANGNLSYLAVRNDILENHLKNIQDSTIDYLNATYGGEITIETFPPVLSVTKDTVVRLHNVSTVSTGATAMEYVGAGITYNALPFFGGEPAPVNERKEINNGKCFTVTSDQVGNYRIGEFFTVNALTGEITIDAEKLNLSGLASIGPFRRNGIPVGVVLREVSNNPNLIASTGAQDGNTVPTQQAVSIYVENRYLNKVQDTTPQTVASEVIFEQDVAIDGNDLTSIQNTFNLLNETVETLNIGGEATSVNIAAATGTTTINNNLAIGGAVISAPQPVVDIVNTFTTTVNFAGEATEINLGANTGELNVNNETINFNNATQVNINGADLVIASSDDGTLTLFNNNISEVNAFGDADLITIGSSDSNVIFTGDIQVDGGDITTTQNVFNLINENATVVNFAGDASEINIGTNTGTTTVNNSFDVLQNTTLGLDTDSFTTIRGEITLSLRDNTSTVLNIAEASDTYIKVDTTNGNELVTVGATPKVTILNTTDSTSSISGAVTIAGGVGIAKKLYVGDNLVVNGSTTLGDERSTDIHTISGATSVNVPDNTATAFEVKENTQSYIKVVTTNGGESVTIDTTPRVLINNTTDSSNKDSGALVVEGGVGIEKNLTVGVDLTVDRDVFVKDDLDVDGDANIDGGNLTTGAATFNLLDTTATTVNAFGAATTIDIGANSGTLTVNNAGTVFNSTSYVKIPVGNLSQRPDPASAGMIRYNSELSTFEGFGPGGNWGSLGGVKDVDGNTYIIPETAPGADENILFFYNDGTNTAQLTATALELYHNTPSVDTTSGSLVVTGGAGISENLYLGGNIDVTGNALITGTLEVVSGIVFQGDLAVNGGDLTTTAGTFNLINANATIVNFAGAGTDINIGAATGTTNIKNNLDVDGDVNIDGGDLTVSTATFNLANTTATTVNFAGAATDLQIGAATGTTNINNNLDVDGDVNIDGDAITTTATNFDLLNTTATVVNFAGDGTTITIGATTGTTTIRNDTAVTGDLAVNGGDLTTISTTFNLANANATTVNAFGAATTIEIGAATGTTNINNNLDVDGDVNIDGDDLTTSSATFNLLNATATTVSAFGAATTLEIGAATGTTNINNNLTVDLDLAVNGGDLTTTAGTFNLLNANATTVNFAGAATTIEIGAGSGDTTINNNLTVDLDLAVNGGDLTTTATTFNLLNANAISVNFAGAATTIEIGAATGTTNINNNLNVDGDVNIDGGDLTASTATFNLLSTNVTTLNLADVATAVNVADNALSASTLTYGPAITGNTFKLAGTASGTVNYTTDVTSGTVNAWQSVTGIVNIGANGAINLGTNNSAATTVKVGSTITGNTLKVASTASGTINLTTDVTSGTVNLFNEVTTGGTVNLATGSDVIVNIGGVDSIVNIKELTLATDLEVQYGGTGVGTFTTNGVIFGNGTDPLLVTAASNPGSNALTSYGILTTDVNNVPVWTDVIDGGEY